MKQEKTISTEMRQYGKDWPPEDALGLLDWLQKKLDAVPNEYRDTVRIAFDSIDSRNGSSATIEFSYVRLETDKEEAEREGFLAASAERLKSSELRTLAALQAKYGNPAA